MVKGQQAQKETQTSGRALHISYHGAAEIEYGARKLVTETVQKEKASQNDQKQEGLIPVDTSVKQL